MKVVEIVFKGLLGLGLLCAPYVHSQEYENKVPKVKFLAPHGSDTFRWNDLVSYEISISDHEDGETEYDEINMNEVFLVVKYLKDPASKEDYLAAESSVNYEPLVQMGSRSCFNCHMAKGVLIGPSFNEITKKYGDDPVIVEKLADKIIAGSSNVWGDEIMPSHPDLNMKTAKEIVQWILNNNTDSDKEILVGTKGTFKISQSKETTKTGIYVLTAFYTDHGLDDNPESRKRSYQNRVIQIE